MHGLITYFSQTESEPVRNRIDVYTACKHHYHRVHALGIGEGPQGMMYALIEKLKFTY